jgi:hypothetical protein
MSRLDTKIGLNNFNEGKTGIFQFLTGGGGEVIRPPPPGPGPWPICQKISEVWRGPSPWPGDERARCGVVGDYLPPPPTSQTMNMLAETRSPSITMPKEAGCLDPATGWLGAVTSG